MNQVSLPHPNELLVIEPLDYENAYDFHRPHRHDYFEILLVRGGTGSQLIDSTRYQLETGKLFAIYPGQIHLMQRHTAQGVLIQFRKEIFEYLHPLRHHYLYFQTPEFACSPALFEYLYELTVHMSRSLENRQASPFSIHKAYNYLQIFVITLLEQCGIQLVTEEGDFAGRFLSLLSRHIREKRKVAQYADLMMYSTDKLTALCKKSFGKTPLALIHEELLLEIRRLFMLGQLSLKEIAFELEFDTPANFSTFIKSSTGKTPKELQAEMRSILPPV